MTKGFDDKVVDLGLGSEEGKIDAEEKGRRVRLGRHCSDRTEQRW